jgi:hypothetical protein
MGDRAFDRRAGEVKGRGGVTAGSADMRYNWLQCLAGLEHCMREETQIRASIPMSALLVGSVVAGLGASVPAILVVLGFSMLLAPETPPWANPPKNAALAVGTGASSGAIIGFPLLVLLRVSESHS